MILYTTFKILAFILLIWVFLVPKKANGSHSRDYIRTGIGPNDPNADEFD